MSNEFLLEVCFIKIRVKGYIENKTEKTKEIIDTYGIKDKEKITYIHNEIKHILELKKDKIILIRQNKEYTHQIIFEKEKEIETEYYLHNFNMNLFINIKTKNIEKNKNNIKITYQIIDSNQEFIYFLEMSDNK